MVGKEAAVIESPLVGGKLVRVSLHISTTHDPAPPLVRRYAAKTSALYGTRTNRGLRPAATRGAASSIHDTSIDLYPLIGTVTRPSFMVIIPRSYSSTTRTKLSFTLPDLRSCTLIISFTALRKLRIAASPWPMVGKAGVPRGGFWLMTVIIV